MQPEAKAPGDGQSRPGPPVQASARLRALIVTVLDVVPGLRPLIRELGRIELIDRSLALGAQALLAIIPMLMALGAFFPEAWGHVVLEQIRDVVGMEEDAMAPLRDAAVPGVGATETGLVGLLVTVVSASSFARALQRMYARVWLIPAPRGARALERAMIWLVAWVLTMQVIALLIGSLKGFPGAGALGAAGHLVTNTVLWWWTAHLLLDGRVTWRRLLPGAATTAVLLLLLTTVSRTVMPQFTRNNLEQYGPLGVVFAVGSWLVVFGGTLVVAAVVGRLLSEWRSGAAAGKRNEADTAAWPGGGPGRLPGDTP